MIINIINKNNEFVVVTNLGRYSVEEAANIVRNTDDDEEIYISDEFCDILDRLEEEDKSEYPNYDFLPYTLLDFFYSLLEKTEVNVASEAMMKGVAK